MAIYKNTSPYAETPIVNGYLDVLNLIDLPAYSDDPQFALTPKYMHRPDLLAHDLYNDSNLWWVFSVRNKSVIKDPIYDMVPGQTIYIPRLTTIRNATGNI